MASLPRATGTAAEGQLIAMATMDFWPILAALRRHRMAAILIVLEIALSCAIFCNAIFMVNDRLSRMRVPTGMAEDELVYVQTGGAFPGGHATRASIVEEHLAALRGIRGVRSAIAVNSLPLSDNMWNFDLTLRPEDDNVAALAGEYMTTGDAVDTMGLKLLEGRRFTAEDAGDQLSFVPTAAVTIIARPLADKLWPGGDALGRQIYIGKQGFTVVGVVEHLATATILSSETADYSMLFPARAGAIGGQYLLRVAPDDRARTLADAVAALRKISPTAIIMDQMTFGEMRAEYFGDDRSMAGLLVAVCVLLLIVTALGIVGLASFWVQGRTRQIGVRRALGATRGDILRYFQTENFLIVSGGIALGMVLAYGLNFWLQLHYELQRLPLVYFPVGAITLWLLGQLAVLGPALRAARVPPVVATRSA